MTRSFVYSIVSFLSGLACIFPFLTFSQSSIIDSTSFVTPRDSIKREEVIEDSSTAFNHMYQYYISGSDEIVYTNLGALVDYPYIRIENEHPGFNAFHTLLDFPASQVAVNHSHFSYLKGTKQEQAFTAGFSQKMFKYFHLQGNFRTINSPGFFINQLNKILNYQVSLGYLSKNKKYNSSVFYTPSIIEEQLNGGIANDTLLSSIDNNDGKSLQVLLSDASLKYRNRKLAIMNKYHFLKKDSTSLVSWFIAHRLNYYTSSYIYNSKSANTDFYSVVYFDSTATTDSLYFSSVRNEVKPGIYYQTDKGKGEVSFPAGIESIRYHVFDSTLITEIITTGFELNYNTYKGKYELKGNLKQSDVYQAAYDLSAKAMYSFVRLPLNASVNGIYRSDFPEAFYNHYASNHFRWTNNFKNTRVLNVSGELVTKNNQFKVSAAIYNFKNYIYFNESALPAQYGSDFNVVKFKLKINIPLFANIHFYEDGSYQYSSNSTIYRIPELYSYSALYHESKIFKRAMKLSFGAGCYYFSSFKSNAFMPATSQFYLQNDVNIGNYPYLDAFVNFRIKTVSFFAKLEHLNQGISAPENYYLPHQPTPGRCIKVGLKWEFSEYQRIIR